MKQCTDTLLMVRPSSFGYNFETAASNTFQNKTDQTGISELAAMEFNRMVDRLREEGIGVIVVDDNPKINTPDSVFPNNWVTMHADGKIIIYPMAAANRRTERRDDLHEILVDQYGFQVKEIIDLCEWENRSHFLEGTGSMIFDHLNRKVYLSRSIRSSESTLASVCEWIGYEPVVFNTKSYDNQPIYHTNVMLSIGEKFAVICNEAIITKDSRRVLDSLEQSGRSIIEISEEQMFSFAGNLLEIRNYKQDPFIALSATALNSFKKNQIRSLEQFASLLPMDIRTIEKHGGGSVRCMIAEVFLPNSREQIDIREVTSEQDLEKCFDIRYEVLRKPWNQPLGSERDDSDAQSWHFLAQTETGMPVATGRLHLTNETTGQIRYMAVRESFQGKGIGMQLVYTIEQLAKSKGLKRIFLQARQNAVPFYEAAGYTIIEETFLLFGEIRHFSMEKQLE